MAKRIDVVAIEREVSDVLVPILPHFCRPIGPGFWGRESRSEQHFNIDGKGIMQIRLAACRWPVGIFGTPSVGILEYIGTTI